MTQFSAVSSAALDDERLNGNDILVLAALGYHTDKSGWCWPSQKKLAEKARLTRQSVSDSMKRLVRFGYVERYVPENGDLSRIRYRRILDTARAPEENVTPDVAPLVSEADKGVSLTDKGMSSEATRVVAVADKACRPNRHKQEPSNKSKEPDPALAGLFEEIWGPWARKLKAEGHAGRGDGKSKTFELFKRKAAKTDPALIRTLALDHVARSKGYLEGLAVWLYNERYDRGDNVVAMATAAEWDDRLWFWSEQQRWQSDWGPAPNQHGYRGPKVEQQAGLFA